MSSVSSCLCCPCFMFKGEAAERNFGGELNLAKRAAGNRALGRRGENWAAGRWATEGQQRGGRKYLQTKVMKFASFIQERDVWRWMKVEAAQPLDTQLRLHV